MHFAHESTGRQRFPCYGVDHMSNDNIQCTAPGCRKCLPAEHMWLPERKALVRANEGKRVTVTDFPRFALCGRHGHLLRQEGVRVYRLSEEVARERKVTETRSADQLSWKPFASRFVSTKPASNPPTQPRRPAGDGRNVGGGLSALAKVDAAKRPPEQKEEPAAPPSPEAAPPAVKATGEKSKGKRGKPAAVPTELPTSDATATERKRSENGVVVAPATPPTMESALS